MRCASTISPGPRAANSFIGRKCVAFQKARWGIVAKLPNRHTKRKQVDRARTHGPRGASMRPRISQPSLLRPHNEAGACRRSHSTGVEARAEAGDQGVRASLRIDSFTGPVELCRKLHSKIACAHPIFKWHSICRNRSATALPNLQDEGTSRAKPWLVC